MNEIQVEKTTDVVSVYVPRVEDLYWLPIPGFSLYMASSLGTIWRAKNGKPIKPMSQHMCKTTVGSYIAVAAFTDEKVRRYVGVHQLVCSSMLERPAKQVIYGLTVMDYRDGTIHTFKRASEAARTLGVRQTAIKDVSKYPKNLKLYKGYVFQRDYQLVSFPMFKEIEILASIHSHKQGSVPIDVTDLDNDTTKRYWSASQFAKEIGVREGTISRAMKSGKVFRDRYVVKNLLEE